MADNWFRPADSLPPEGEEVATMNSGGQVQTLVYKTRLWWFPDMMMYVYYVPTFWQHITRSGRADGCAPTRPGNTRRPYHLFEPQGIVSLNVEVLAEWFDRLDPIYDDEYIATVRSEIREVLDASQLGRVV
jgi:hypothetical protein